MRREYRERFSRPDFMRDARAEMHAGIAKPRWRGKRSRHSQRMRNLQIYVSGNRPIEVIGRRVPSVVAALESVIGSLLLTETSQTSIGISALGKYLNPCKGVGYNHSFMP